MRVRVYKIIGLCLSVIPPAVTALCYFPLWFSSRGSAFSVLSILLLALCMLPFRRVIRDYMRSPSAWQMWFVLWVGLTLFARICNGLRVVACVGSVSGLVGEVFFFLSRRAADASARDTATHTHAGGTARTADAVSGDVEERHEA